MKIACQTQWWLARNRPHSITQSFEDSGALAKSGKDGRDIRGKVEKGQLVEYGEKWEARRTAAWGTLRTTYVRSDEEQKERKWQDKQKRRLHTQLDSQCYAMKTLTFNYPLEDTRTVHVIDWIYLTSIHLRIDQRNEEFV